MKIAFLTTGDPTNRHSWSGIDYYMSQALQAHCGDVCYSLSLMPTLRYNIGRALNKASLLLLRHRYAYLHSFLLSKGYAQNVRDWLSNNHVDLIFVPSASPIAAFLNTRTPVVYLSGATFALMCSYYPQYSKLLPLSVREGNAIEQSLIDRSKLLLYPSEWPAKSAVLDYHADQSKVHIIPYGANLDKDDVPSLDTIRARKRSKRCRLLFIGVDWRRKGGHIAFDTLLELENLGIDAELTVCGCTPPKEFQHKNVKVIPFLDKNDPIQRGEFGKLLLNSDFLLMPTRSECFGVVFCEASAFGLPAITTDTGGVSGAITEGMNGHMLPLSCTGVDYARLIADIYADEKRCRELSRTSRRVFEERLNWDAWGKAVGSLLREINTQGRSLTNTVSSRSRKLY